MPPHLTKARDAYVFFALGPAYPEYRGAWQTSLPNKSTPLITHRRPQNKSTYAKSEELFLPLARSPPCRGDEARRLIKVRPAYFPRVPGEPVEAGERHTLDRNPPKPKTPEPHPAPQE